MFRFSAPDNWDATATVARSGVDLLAVDSSLLRLAGPHARGRTDADAVRGRRGDPSRWPSGWTCPRRTSERARRAVGSARRAVTKRRGGRPAAARSRHRRHWSPHRRRCVSAPSPPGSHERAPRRFEITDRTRRGVHRGRGPPGADDSSDSAHSISSRTSAARASRGRGDRLLALQRTIQRRKQSPRRPWRPG